MDSFRKILGAIIRRHREAQGLSQERLAELSALHHNHIGKVERGESAVSAEKLVRIGEALGVPAWELLKEAQQDAGGHETDD